MLGDISGAANIYIITVLFVKLDDAFIVTLNVAIWC